jgi:uncharacterized HAD superfamily protein
LNKTIFVDIDGIITNETLGHDFISRTPNQKNINIINEIYKNNKVVLYTSRYIIDYFVTKKWLKKNNVLYHRIIFNKPKYDIFVDDRCFNNFEEIK